MKKFLLLIYCIVPILILAQEPQFKYITDDLQYVKKPMYGFTYEGYADSSQKPKCWGTLRDGIGFIGLTGQISNGAFDGYCISPFYNFYGILQWPTSQQKPTSIGWTYVPDDVSYNNSFVFDGSGAHGGLRMTKFDNKYYQGWARDEYVKQFYDNQKENIAKICANYNIKYVEDYDGGNYKYSGGWKDKKPYMIGAYKTLDEVFCGSLIFDAGTNTFSPGKGWWQQFNNKGYYTLKSRTSSGQMYVEISCGFWTYKKITLNDKGDMLEFEIIQFGRDPHENKYSYGKRTKVDEDFWGCQITAYKFYEGYLNTKTGEIKDIAPVRYGRTLSADGIQTDFSIQDGKKALFKYPNGSTFWLEEDLGSSALGIKTSTSGEYYVGLFSWSDLKSTDDFSPLYGEGLDKADKVIRNYVNAKGYEEEFLDSKLALLKFRYKLPMKGKISIRYADYTYDGEVKDRCFDGQGVYKSDAYTYEGGFKAGKFDGQGVYKSNAYTYDGGFKAGKFDGKGIYKSDTYTYEGNFLFGKFSDYGKLIYIDETAAPKISMYEGEFMDGEFNGKGIGRYVGDTVKFQGKWWQNHFQSGKIMLDGAILSGSFQDFFLITGNIQLSDTFLIYCDYWINELASSNTLHNGYNWKGVPQGSFSITTPRWSFTGSTHDTNLLGEYSNLVENYKCVSRFSRDGASVSWRPINVSEIIFSTSDTLYVEYYYNSEVGKYMFVPKGRYEYIWKDGRRFVGEVKNDGLVGKGTYYYAEGKKASKKEYITWEMQQLPNIEFSIPESKLFNIFK